MPTSPSDSPFRQDSNPAGTPPRIQDTPDLPTRLIAEAAATILSTPYEGEGVLDYTQLKPEHAELIASGANGVVIGEWAGERFGLSNWARGEQHGEWQTFSTPEGDLTQLIAFLKQGFGIDWSLANGGSDNHPTFHLTNGYVLNALFGKRNMRRASARNVELAKAWQDMGEFFGAKEKYLKEKIGLDIKGDWGKLTGTRYANGRFGCSNSLSVSGPLSGDGDGVLGMLLYKEEYGDGRSKASDARIFFLA